MTTELPEDRRAHREWLLALAAVPAAGLVVDVGCGRGEDLCLLAAAHPGVGLRLVGLDPSAESLAVAAERAAGDTRVSFRTGRADDRLPFDDGSVDVLYSHNVLECLADPGAFAREAARVVRPGGQVVVGHWDWDSQTFDGADKARVRRLVHAYADWEQAWMEHADGWMGRRLWGAFNPTGAFAGRVHARVLTNTAYAPPHFGHENARALRSLVRRGLADAADVEAFEREQRELHERGRYFYSITGYAYVGTRLAAPR